MTIARPPDEIERKPEAVSKIREKPKSGEFVREALARYFYEEETEKSSWEIGEPYFGKYSSGERDLSVTCKDRLKDSIRARRCLG
jgi:hypothetical protein